MGDKNLVIIVFKQCLNQIGREVPADDSLCSWVEEAHRAARKGTGFALPRILDHGGALVPGVTGQQGHCHSQPSNHPSNFPGLRGHPPPQGTWWGPSEELAVSIIATSLCPSALGGRGSHFASEIWSRASWESSSSSVGASEDSRPPISSSSTPLILLDHE